MKRKLVSSVAALALVLSSSPTLAEDAADPQAATKAETDRLKAQTELVKAQADALGLPKFDGTTTLEANAGQMESWILTAQTIDKAADRIVEALKGKTDNGVLIIGKEETLNLSLPTSVKAEMATLQRSLDTVRVADGCAPPKPVRKPATTGLGSNFGLQLSPGGESAQAAAAAASGGGSILPLAGAVLSALKGNTTISGISLSPGDQLLIDSLAGKLTNSVTPSELVSTGDISKTEIGETWNKLVKAREETFKCRSRIAPYAKDKDIEGRVAVLDGAIAAVDAFAARATLSSDDKPSLLVRAMLLDKLAEDNRPVLRVNIEQAGGSLWKRDSLWTALGFSGVRLTGGLIVSYRLSDPTTGGSKAGGLVVCRTDFASMKAIQTGRTLEPDCEPIVGRKRPAVRQGG